MAVPKASATPSEAMQTTTVRCPDTLRHPVDATLDMKLPNPHVPRALVAADNDHPYGSTGHEHNNYTVLQQHVEFFDRNKDGVIYPWETFSGFRAIGFGYIISFWAMCIINISMSYPSQPSWIPSPFFSIHMRNIHRAIHGSDSGVFDSEGRFIPAKFEELFSKYAKTFPDRMTFRELISMTESLRDAFDLFGWGANKLEWGLSYWIARDDKGYVHKEAVRGIYDGSFFYYLEKRESAKSIARFY